MRSEGYSSRSVCPSVRNLTILALQATRRLMSDTNSFSAIRARKECNQTTRVHGAGARYGVLGRPLSVLLTRMGRSTL